MAVMQLSLTNISSFPFILILLKIILVFKPIVKHNYSAIAKCPVR